MSYVSRLRLAGLELTPDREPATPTLVFCLSARDYQVFINSCEIRNGVRNKRVKMITENSGSEALRGIPQSWAHVAFIGIDPREYLPPSDSYYRSPWYELDRLRQRRHFRRAFYYPEWYPSSIIPNIMEGEREW